MALAIVLASPAHAATVTSPAPDRVAVTLYRDPTRGAGAIERDWPTGYALVTETRTVTLPAGASVLRFEGVADGMLAESAIITGLPKGVREKNRDARLLSPAALVQASLTRRVHLKRTNRKTGAVREEDAIVRAGPDGGIVLQTAAGFEALGCSGLPEALTYDSVPDGLTPKPTLSVLTEAERPVTATVRLSYLAQGFDWAASYVADIAPDGKTLDLFAWVTAANGGAVSFPDAAMQAVAGAPNRTRTRYPAPEPAPPLVLQCWPSDTTSTIHAPPPPPPPPPAPVMMAEDIVVTGMRREKAMMAAPVMIAKQEELGDLKLYRIPEPVTILPKSQKQIAMIVKPRVPFDRVYTTSLSFGATGSRPLTTTLRLRNLAARGLGVPLPSGRVAVFANGGGRRLYVGESDMGDRALGEKVDVAAGEAADVRLAARADPADPKAKSRGATLTLTNATAHVAAVEVTLPYRLKTRPPGVVREDGVDLWRITVPANGAATLRLAMAAEE